MRLTVDDQVVRHILGGVKLSRYARLRRINRWVLDAVAEEMDGLPLLAGYSAQWLVRRAIRKRFERERGLRAGV